MIIEVFQGFFHYSPFLSQVRKHVEAELQMFKRIIDVS